MLLTKENVFNFQMGHTEEKDKFEFKVIVKKGKI